jgi:hypothetical protein
VLVHFHDYARSAKGHAFHAQAESLFSGGFAKAFNRAPGTDDAMPWQSRHLPQDADDLPRRTRPSSGPCDRSVG